MAGTQEVSVEEVDGVTTADIEQDRFVSTCCQCGKIRVGDTWHHPDAVDVGSARLTHGYCPDCFRKAMLAFEPFLETAELATKAG